MHKEEEHWHASMHLRRSSCVPWLGHGLQLPSTPGRAPALGTRPQGGPGSQNALTLSTCKARIIVRHNSTGLESPGRCQTHFLELQGIQPQIILRHNWIARVPNCSQNALTLQTCKGHSLKSQEASEQICTLWMLRLIVCRFGLDAARQCTQHLLNNLDLTECHDANMAGMTL